MDNKEKTLAVVHVSPPKGVINFEWDDCSKILKMVTTREEGLQYIREKLQKPAAGWYEIYNPSLKPGKRKPLIICYP